MRRLAIILCLIPLAAYAASPIIIHPGSSAQPSDGIAPTVQAPIVVVTGTTLVLNLSEVVKFAGGVPSATGFSVSASGGAATLTYASGADSANLSFTTSRTIGVAETVTLDYNDAAGDVEDLAGNDLASFTGQEVTVLDPGDGDTAPKFAIPGIEFVQVGSEINYTPTLTAGTGVIVYSATNIPDGATLNTETGAVTGTCSTPGKYYMKITATNEEGYDRCLVPVHVYSQKITADLAWLLANQPSGTNPYQLGGSYDNCWVQLAAHVTHNHTAFAISGDNVTLDLNGYSITYGNEAQPVWTAGDFTDAEDWNFAGNIEHVPAANFLGQQCWPKTATTACKFTTPAANQSITCNETITLEAGKHYALKFHVATLGDSNSTWAETSNFYVSISNGTDTYTAGTSQLFSSNPERGIQLVATEFTAGSGGAYTVTIGCTDANVAGLGTTYMSHIQVVRRDEPGVVIGLESASRTEMCPWATSGGGTGSDSPWIVSSAVGGAITQATASYQSSAVREDDAVYQLAGGAENDPDCLTITVYGAQSRCLDFGGTGYAMNYTIHHDPDSIVSRDHGDGVACYQLTYCRNMTVTEFTSITAGTDRGGPTSIFKEFRDINIASGTGEYTNCFTIGANPPCDVLDNTISLSDGTDSGEGILLGWAHAVDSPARVLRNNITAKDAGINSEYGGLQQAGCLVLQAEYGADMEIAYNTITVTGARGAAWRPSFGAYTAVEMHDNTITALADAGTTYAGEVYHMTCMFAAASSPSNQTSIHDETYVTNFCFARADQYATILYTLEDCTFRYINDGNVDVPRPWIQRSNTVSGGRWNIDDPTYYDAGTETYMKQPFRKANGGGLTTAGAEATSLYFRHDATVTFKSGGTPVANTAVIITDAEDNVVYSGNTNASGQVTLTDANEVSWLGPTQTDYNPYTASVTGYQDATFTVDETTRSGQDVALTAP